MMSSVRIEPMRWLVLVFGFGIATAFAELPPLSHGLTPVDARPAPALRLVDLDDEIWDIKEMRGKVVVVNFWATWCPPCRREMPSLERLRSATEDKDVIVVAVNIGEDADTVSSFLGTVEPSPTFPMLFDPDAQTLPAWQVKGLPTTFVVGPDGMLAYSAIGGREFDHPELVRQLLDLHPTETPR